MKITVAICTWNRAKLLDQTLTQMHKLCIPEGVEWELLVVNNNCTDDTDAVLARHSDTLPLRRLWEPKQGHSNARNCAIDHAKGELLLWTDDDVLVDPDWLACYAQASHDWPDASFFGGLVEPWFAEEPAAWVKNNIGLLADVYALRDLGKESRRLHDNEFPVGASMAFRLSVLHDRRFDSRLGRMGNELLGGDELQFLTKLRQQGHQGVWVSAARVRHYIPAVRLTRKFVGDWQRGCGRTFIRQHPDENSPRLFGLPRWIIRRYLQSLLQYFVLAPFRGKQWLHAFLAYRHTQGMVYELLATR